MIKTTLRAVAAAIAIVSASAAAHAAGISATLNFDTVPSGTLANDYTAGLGLSAITFGNGDTVSDAPVYDAIGHITNPGAFHWVDMSSTYGPVTVQSSPYAVSGPNLLFNGFAPILVQFSSAMDIASFSIQQDTSGFGNPQTSGSYLAFLDSTGHELSAANVFYTQFAQPGLTITSSGSVAGVSAILLQSGLSYDNLSITATPAAAVPEPEGVWLLAAGMLVMGFISLNRDH